MATEAQINAICGLYVAYFDRAADPEGLQFWIDQLDNGRDFATISQDFANSQEARDIYPFLNNPDVASPGAFITSIYANLFDRAPESEGLTFWTDVLESGAVAPGDMVEAILLGARDDFIDGELVQDATIVANKIEAAKYYAEEAANTPGFEFDQTAYNAARAAINDVDATEESVADSRFDTDNFIGQAGNQTSGTHTLMEQKILVSPEVVTEQLITETVLYWGFNPHGHDETAGVDNTAEPNTNNLTNEGIEDGGIPAADFFNKNGFLDKIAEQTFDQINTIDTDVDDFPFQEVDFSAGVRDISITANAADGTGGVITFTFPDGSSDDIALGTQYFELIRDLIFDAEGNSRFFEKEVAVGVPVYLDDDGNPTLENTGTALFEADGDQATVDAVLETVEGAVYATVPLILTPTQNNNATQERSFTDSDGVDDTIVAGRLELLHNAFIDAGLGFNTLEIEAKGYFAQAKQLKGIQQINIHQLPNIYTDDQLDEDGDGEIDVGAENLFPNISADGAFDNDSIIDISRATDLEALTLTQGDFEDLNGSGGGNDSVEVDPGDLTVTGIRNGAIAVIDGGWTGSETGGGDLRLNYSELQGDGVYVVFNNLHMDEHSDLEIAHNATKLTIESTGGGNYIYDGNLGRDGSGSGSSEGLNTLIITGDAHLHIDQDMDDTFNDNTPITVDASANTGGVDLNFTATEKVTFIGSQSDDRLSLNTADSDIDQGPTIGDDQEIVIEGGVGDNYYNVETDDKLTITNADGNNNYEIDANVASITAGGGNNFIQGEAAHLTAGFGDGDNRIDLNLVDSNDREVTGIDTVETGANITLGDGANNVVIKTNDEFSDAPEVSVKAGDGGNTILLPQSGSDSGGGAGAVNLMLILDNSDSMTPALLQEQEDAVNALLDQIENSGVSSAAVSVVFGSGATSSSWGSIDNVRTVVNGLQGDSGGTDYVAALDEAETAWASSGKIANATNLSVFISDGVPGTSIDATREGEWETFLENNDIVSNAIGVGGLTDAAPLEPIAYDGAAGQDIAPQLATSGLDLSDILTSIGDTIGVVNGQTLVNAHIETGAGDDTILVAGAEITISSGGGDDEITLLGVSNDVVTQFAQLNGDTGWTPAPAGYNGLSLADDGTFLYNGFEASTFGAKITIDTGPGSSTINLGAFNDSLAEVSGNIVADEGSSITGEDITIFVNTHADLRAASLDGISQIIMDDDSHLFAGQGDIGDGGESAQDTESGGGTGSGGDRAGDTPASNIASLTLFDSQVAALGAGVFSTQGQLFGAQSVLNIVITEDTELSDLIDLSALASSVKLAFVVEDGATLTMTAEELHTYVAPNGIAVDEQNGFIDNQVVITDAGFDFDAYNNQNGGIGGGTIAGASNQPDVSIIRTADGFARPAQDNPSDSITVDSDDTPVVDDVISFFASELVIEGSADLEITGRVDLGDNFTIDFSDFTGNFLPENADGVEEAMTIVNFQDLTDAGQPYQWGRIDGNGTSDDPVRINVVMQDDTTVGDTAFGVAKGGIKSSGVQQYVLTGFVGTDGYLLPQVDEHEATIVVCDCTEDLEVLGLQNNRNAKVIFEQVNWTTDILMEGDGFADSSEVKNLGNPDYSQVGYVVANFFEPGINASVRITNQGTELGQNEDALDGFDPDGERKLEAAGITVNNADRLLITVEDGDALVKDVTGADVERVIVNGPEDVEIVINGTEDPGSEMMDGLDSDDLKSIDGSGVGGEFTLTFTADTDLSEVDLTGVDKIKLDADLTLTLNADQVVALGSVIETTNGNETTLNVTDYEGEGIDFSALDVSDIGDITFSDVDGTITVDPAANFGGADELIIPAEDSDTNVEMTVAQFETTEDGNVTMEEGADTDGKLTLTEVPGDQELNLSMVTAGGTGSDGVADVNLVGSDFVSTEDFLLTDDAAGNDGDLNLTATLTGGVNDITETPVPNLIDLDELILEDGATLNITAAQLEVLYTDNDELTIADGANVTINVTDLSDQVLDLDTLVDENSGVNIGTITIADTNTAVTIDGGTTFGGADQIITPTADENDAPDGVEDTTLTMTVAQYLTSAGIVTGDALTDLTDLIHNNDSDGDVVVDNALVDTSGITAPKGTIGLGQSTVMLNENTDISGFEIELTNGQMIQFATEEQAAAEVTEVGIGAITAIGWKFDSVTGPVNTDGYDPNINTLYVKEDLVDGVNEESLWTFLPGTIKVEKVNDGLPDVLIGVDRVNTFQAFTSNDGVSFDDQNEFFTVANLTLNLEGNTDIGDIGIGDTVVPSGDPNNPDSAIFETLYINSYLDEESTQFPFGTAGAPGGITFQPNKIGDVVLNAGSMDEITNIEIRTFTQVGDLGSGAPNQQSVAPGDVDADGFTVTGSGGFFDMANVGDTNGHERDGLDIETGVLTFAANDPTIGNLLIEGANDATIGGIDISDDEVTLVDVNVENHTGTLAIDDYGDFFDLNPSGGFDHIYIADGHTVDSAPTTPDDIADSGTNALIVAGGDNDFTAESALAISNVHVTGAGTTLTLTADQVAAITIADTTPSDGIADNWTVAPGASVTLNITEFDTQSLDLDAIAAAGFDIGTITTSDAGGEVASGTTFGMADAFNILVDTSDTTVEMTAAQYQTIENGNVGEVLTPNAVANDLVANIHVDELEGIEASPVDIDLSTVNVSGDQILAISEFDDGTLVTDGDGDVTLSDTSLLGDFAIRLWDINTGSAGPDQLAGETIRFTTEAQADGRVVNVAGADDDSRPNANDPDNEPSGTPIDEGEKDEKDTNVVWVFESIAGPNGLDVSGYDGLIGRIWLPEALVDSVGGDVDSLFSVDDGGTPDFTLDPDIIKRIEAGDLAELLLQSVAISQRVEITSYTNTSGLEFEVDDPLVDLAELRIDFGGVTDIGNLELDNILGPVNPDNPNFPGDDDFGLLTLNSYLANSNDHYLLPDSFDPDDNPLPSNTLQITDPSNNIGDISSGADRGVLRDIEINLGTGTSGAVDEGTDLNVGTVFFSDDGDTTAVGGDGGTPIANLDIDGVNDVLFKSLDASDADITTLIVDTTGHTGTVTITGGSPAFDLDDVDDTTETLTLTNGGAGVGVITAASSIDFNGTPVDPTDDIITYTTGAGQPAPWAGVSGGALSTINTADHGGTISLGVISQVDGDDFTLNNSDVGGGSENGGGQVHACLGEGMDGPDVETPTLNAGGTWTFDGVTDGGGDNNLDLEMKAANFGAGTLVLEDVDVTVTGDIDFTGLDTLTVTGGTTINVAAGATLTLTVAQVDDLEDASVNIFGEGKVVVTGESDDSDGEINTDFGNLNTAEVDLSAVTLGATDDGVLNITANGAHADDTQATPLVVDGDRVAQTIIGSDNNDAVTVTSAADDGDIDTIDVITRLGADSGDIGEPNATPSGNTPTDPTPEVEGDRIDTNDNDVRLQVEADAGFDTLNEISSRDSGGAVRSADNVIVSAGAEFYAEDVFVDFEATDESTNDGIAVIEDDGTATVSQPVIIDVSAAGGANGWSLIGGPDSGGGPDHILIGSDQDDNTTLVDGAASGVSNAGQEDTHTGNAGADVFEFNHKLSTPGDPVVAETTAATDEEEITITADSGVGAGADDDDESLVVTYSVNGAATALTVDNTPPLDVTDANAVAAAVAAALDGVSGVSATSSGDTVTAEGDGSNSFEVLSVAALGTTDTLAGSIGEGADDPQVNTVTIPATVAVGEVYTISVTTAEGTLIEASFEATTTSGTDVATGLVSVFDAQAPAVSVDSDNVAGTSNVITLTDENADNGGFTVTSDAAPAVVATSASSFGGAVDGSPTFVEAAADTITDFVSGEDSIDLNAVAGDGDGSNYVEAPETADYATALTDAGTAMDGTVAYYLTSTATDGGLLFFDADGNGSVDGVVSLPGIDEDNFEAGDIMG